LILIIGSKKIVQHPSHMDEQLLDRLQAEARYLANRLDHLRVERAAGRLTFNQWKEFFTVREQLHAITLKLKHPDALVVHDAKVRGFKLSKQTDVKALIAALDRRGVRWSLDVAERTIELETTAGFEVRTYDVAVVHGARDDAILQPTELKTRNKYLNDIKGALSSPKVREGLETGRSTPKTRERIKELFDEPIEGKFKVRSGRQKLTGGQLETERWLKDLAREHRIDGILLSAKNVDGHLPTPLQIRPENLKLSRVATYQAPSAGSFAQLRATIHGTARTLARQQEIRAARQPRARPTPDAAGMEDAPEGARGTTDRGVDETLAKARASATDGVGDIDEKLSGLDPDAPKAAVEAPRVKRSLAKSILKFGKGFLIDQLVDLAIALFVGYFQRRVTEDNTRLMRDAWKRNVAPKVEPLVRHWIARSAAGHTFNLADDQKYVYVEIEWTLMLEELREDASDVIVWFGKFFAQDPGFGEVYYDLQISRQPDPDPYKPRNGELAHDRMEDREPNRKKVGINDYVFTQYFLVHDPDVLATAKRMFSHAQTVHMRFDKVLQEWRSSLIRFEPPSELVAEVRTALDTYQFRKASAAMDSLAAAMDETSMSTRALKKLSAFATSRVFVNPSFLPQKHRDLLDAYLGVHLESDVSVEPNELVVPRSGRSSTHHTIDNPGQKFH
jgi:hypothetical protein